MSVLKFPISRITIFFILGILISFYCKLPAKVSWVLLFISFSICLFFLIKSNVVLQQQKGFGISLCFLFFCLGITTVSLKNITYKSNHFIHNNAYFKGNHQLKFVILEKLKNGKKNYRFVAQTFSINNRNITGKVLLNLDKNIDSTKINTGSIVLIKSCLIKNFNINNPNQFDYNKYLEIKGIYAQVFAKQNQVKISAFVQKSLAYYASKIRNNIIHNLKTNGIPDQELSIIMALILGQQQDISPSVVKDYQYAGAVHMLSVSGLHIGFILYIVSFILKPLPKNMWGNITKLILTLLFIWLFAIIAGLAACVVRSATMFSCIAIGECLKKRPNGYYNLCISLLIILIFEPLFIFDIGFQLSYIAVFFIMWLNPLLNNLWLPKNKVLKYFWDIITVSFAAQIGTLPLSIYYFHQFPGLFFVTNLVIIPFLAIIITLSIVLIFFALINFIPQLLAQIVAIMISCMNITIHKIGSIDFFIFKEIPLSFSLLISSYLIIFSLFIWLKKPNYIKMGVFLGSLILFQSFYLLESVFNKNELIVFNIPNQTIISERYGKNISFFYNNPFVNDSFESKIITTYSVAHFSKKIFNKKIPNLIFFKNKKILVIDKNSIYKIVINPDIVLLVQSPKLNLERLINTLNPKIIIADGSNKKNDIKVWKATCNKKKIAFHATTEKGYYCMQ